jgi:photosystem II stability/assembly factor-like uncharacterized protein
MHNTNIELLATNSDGTIFANVQHLGVFRYDSQEGTWAHVFPEFRRLLAISNEYIFASNGPYFFRSADEGKTWTQVNWPPLNIRDFAFGPDGKILGATSQGVYRSTDNGDNWHLLDGLGENSVRSLVINSSGQVFAGVGIGNTSNIFRSDDFGDSWLRTGYPYSSSTPSDLAVNSKGHLFAASNSFTSVRRSTNNGDDWSTVLRETDINVMVINSSDDIYAGGDDGMLVSEDNGDTWVSINDGLSSLHVKALAFDANESLFAGIRSRGVFRTVASTTSIKPSFEPLPRSFVLEQNYPNPFSPETTIRFELPHVDDVTINIYNLHGQLVRRFVGEEKQAGYHEIVWDALDDTGRSVPSGVYLYRLQVDNFMEVKKLTLLR